MTMNDYDLCESCGQPVPAGSLGHDTPDECIDALCECLDALAAQNAALLARFEDMKGQGPPNTIPRDGHGWYWSKSLNTWMPVAPAGGWEY
jgi:hypothetical protein